MTRTRTLEHGVEEWSCTECSRRILLRRPPAFEKVVLDRGDQWAAHVGGGGGVRIAAVGGGGGVRIAAADAAPPEQAELRAHDREWLAAQGIDWGAEDTP
jgi:hypothetical protein